ncbi:MAG: CBS domain-containing protein [Planctomycetota bacterium]|nr:CBS domain-containing protein [Planctomycetota bacterium]
MPGIDHEMDEEMYHETTVLHRRHLTDQVLRVPIKHINVREAICVAPDKQLQHVVEIMREKRTGAVLVCDEGSSEILGIFSERDLLLRVAGRGWNFHQHQIREVMSKSPECMTPKDKIGHAINKMMVKGYRHIPIICEKGKPYGMLSVRDILIFLCEHFPEDVINLPPEPMIPTDRDGG